MDVRAGWGRVRLGRAAAGLVALGVMLVAGCKIGPVTIEPPKIDWFGTKARQEAQRKRNEPMNQLYRQGYGFDNPNAERIQQGLPPKNLDGTVDPPAKPLIKPVAVDLLK